MSTLKVFVSIGNISSRLLALNGLNEAVRDDEAQIFISGFELIVTRH
jgi:hypothetical protein